MGTFLFSLVPLSVYEERCMIRKLDLLKKSSELSMENYLLRRKLKLREEKRSLGLPVFNIDAEYDFLVLNKRVMTTKERQLQQALNENRDNFTLHEVGILDRFYASDARRNGRTINDGYRMKLVANVLNNVDFIFSPYTLR